MAQITASLPQNPGGVVLADGSVVKLQNRRHAWKFDRASYGTSVSAGDTTYIFQRANGTTAEVTNILTANKLSSAGGFFQIQRLGIVIQPTATVADADALIRGVTFRLIKNEQDVISRVPILFLPGAYGLSGVVSTAIYGQASATEVTYQAWSNGFPSTGLTQTLAIPIDCFWEDDVYGELFVPTALTLSATTYVYVVAEGVEGVPIR